MQQQPKTSRQQLLGKRTAPQVMRAPGGLIHANRLSPGIAYSWTAARISKAMIASGGVPVKALSGSRAAAHAKSRDPLTVIQSTTEFIVS